MRMFCAESSKFSMESVRLTKMLMLPTGAGDGRGGWPVVARLDVEAGVMGDQHAGGELPASRCDGSNVEPKGYPLPYQSWPGPNLEP
jgi:hypothetical protein